MVLLNINAGFVMNKNHKIVLINFFYPYEIAYKNFIPLQSCLTNGLCGKY